MGEEHEKQKEQQVQGFERSPLPPECLRTIRELVWWEGVSEQEHGGEEVTGGLLKARYYLLTLP